MHSVVLVRNAGFFSDEKGSKYERSPNVRVVRAANYRVWSEYTGGQICCILSGLCYKQNVNVVNDPSIK